MKKCDFCANYSPEKGCLGQEVTHQVGNDAVRYCSEAADRYLKYCEQTLNSCVAHIEIVKGSLNV